MYKAYETQAIGRVRRCSSLLSPFLILKLILLLSQDGQLKTAHVYRLVSRDTIDETILNENDTISVADKLARQLTDKSIMSTFPRTTLKLDLKYVSKKAAKVAKAKAEVKKVDEASDEEASAEESDEDEVDERDYSEDDGGEDSDEEVDEVQEVKKAHEVKVRFFPPIGSAVAHEPTRSTAGNQEGRSCELQDSFLRMLHAK